MNNNEIFLNIAQISTNFIEIPNQISLSLYAQGCAKRCPGCHNSGLQSFSGGSKIFLSDVKNILNEYNMCEWIVYLGGDVVYQPRVVEFNKEFKKHGKKVCLYTGKEFEELDEGILKNIDLVKAGEWKEDRGPVTQDGTNQEFWLKNDGVWSLVRNWDLLGILLNEQVSYNKVF